MSAPAYCRGWICNGQRAYWLVRVRKATSEAILRNQYGDYGDAFSTSLDNLERYGYRPLKRKPAYAERRL